ncbi:hypothetical protein [Streptomyces sp. NPDC006645]|uniref:hypothetical protein n=1 Tax=unclassified Streptomyces TaxID=2593676 RepID=UPI0033A4BD00
MSHGGHGPYGPPPPPYPPYVPYPPPHMPLWRRFREDEWPTLREVLHAARQIHGCLWLLALCCFGPTVVGLLVCYPLARSARSRARRVFPPGAHLRVHFPDVVRIQKTRAWVALAATFVLMAVYATPDDWDQAIRQFALRMAVTPWLLLLSAPLVITVIIRLAAPSARAGMRSRLRPSLRSALWYCGAFAATPGLFVGGLYLGYQLNGTTVLAPILTIALLLPALWVGLFVAFASPTVVRSAFHTAPVHAALPALLTGVLVWEFAAISLATGGLPPGPTALALLAAVGGPATVSALAWWEIHRLRTWHGVRLRA